MITICSHYLNIRFIYVQNLNNHQVSSSGLWVPSFFPWMMKGVFSLVSPQVSRVHGISDWGLRLENFIKFTLLLCVMEEKLPPLLWEDWFQICLSNMLMPAHSIVTDRHFLMKFYLLWQCCGSCTCLFFLNIVENQMIDNRYGCVLGRGCVCVCVC